MALPWMQIAFAGLLLAIIWVIYQQNPKRGGSTKYISRTKDFPLFFDYLGTHAGHPGLYTVYQKSEPDSEGKIEIEFLEPVNPLIIYPSQIIELGQVGDALGGRQVITWKGFDQNQILDLIETIKRLKQELRITRTTLTIDRANRQRDVEEGISIRLEAMKNQNQQQPFGQQPQRRY